MKSATQKLLARLSGCAAPLVALAAIVLPLNTFAQAPFELANSQEAERRYEQKTLNQLRSYCSKSSAASLFERPELGSIKEGYVWQSPDVGAPVYLLYSFDQGTSTFTSLLGQRIAPGLRLKLPLALPRDYSNCRLVRDGSGQEYLEVVQTRINEMAATELITAALGDLASQLSLSPSKCPASRGADLPEYLIHNGARITALPCNDVARNSRARVLSAFRQVFDR